MSDDPMMVAVAAGVLSAGDAHRALLNSVAETARAIFGAKAASIFLYDERTDELVFEAVAGSGADTLIGRRLLEALAEVLGPAGGDAESAGERPMRRRRRS